MSLVQEQMQVDKEAAITDSGQSMHQENAENASVPNNTEEQPQTPAGFKLTSEGRAQFFTATNNEVFYNPAMVNNRDVSVAALRWFSKTRKEEIMQGTRSKIRPSKNSAIVVQPIPIEERVQGLRVMEGLAATGLRSIRYAKEVDGIGRIDAVDLDSGSVDSMKRNVEINKVDEIVKPHLMDSRLLMLQRTGWYDVIDLDPYGTPVSLLDSAVQALNEGGLLMVTATDMAVLCGNSPETCLSKYGSLSLHKPYCHEQALRILLHSIQQHAGRYKRYIVPVLSVSMDYWVRVFVRVYSGAEEVKNVSLRTSHIFQVCGCEGFVLHPLSRQLSKKNKIAPNVGPPVNQTCPETQQRYQIGGPIWSAPIHNMQAVKEMMQDIENTENQEDLFPARKKVTSVLNAISEELEDVPLFYDIASFSSMLKINSIKAVVFKSALINAGYRASGVHVRQTAVKTDAPFDVVLDIMRAWFKEQNPNQKQFKDMNSVKAIVLSKEPTIQVDFKFSAAAKFRQNKPRFVQNPDRWGPRRRHGKKPIEWENGGNTNKRQKMDDTANQKIQLEESQKTDNQKADNKQMDANEIDVGDVDLQENGNLPDIEMKNEQTIAVD